MKSGKWVFRFDEVPPAETYHEKESLRARLGGKGASLAEMSRIGLPVPPGFVIITDACVETLRLGGGLPEGLWDQVLEAMGRIEEATGKGFGDAENPLLVSCRSGAMHSMPGMTDTVLNVGLNDETAAGLTAASGDERFVFDAYRRLIQVFGSLVPELGDEAFEESLERMKRDRQVVSDAEMTASDWKELTAGFKQIIRAQTRMEFPQDPLEQLRMAVQAVFGSWNGKRAIDYRNASGIPHDLGTAVNVVSMVFGNLGLDSGTGVVSTRNPVTGDRTLYGDYLPNAQGKDVVAGIRNTQSIAGLGERMPEVARELTRICRKLEERYRDMQDVEFTVERRKLWILQTRTGQRTARAAIRIAVDLCKEGHVTCDEALLRVRPEDVDVFLHPAFAPGAKDTARDAGNLLGRGVNASPGAAVGRVVFDADTAERWSREGTDVVMVRPFTRPDDVHGMLASRGILTIEGGATSHAAVVARQFGVPCVVGAGGMELRETKRRLKANGHPVREGDWISLDGTSGEIFLGRIPTVESDLEKQEDLQTLLSWADSRRHLGVLANADHPQDAVRALAYGAEGVGLCRTEHMFFEATRLPIVRQMILSSDETERKPALDRLLPLQRGDFEGLFRVMDGRPVVIRLIDPPLHEFLPTEKEIRDRLRLCRDEGRTQEVSELQRTLATLRKLHESNPMMGLRGIRLSIVMPGIVSMQVRAVFEAACNVVQEGGTVRPKILIPLVGHVNELKVIQPVLERVALEVMRERGCRLEYMFGTMIEVPRAAITANQLAEVAEFFSFGTNDLTQMTLGYSRDDAETHFLLRYVDEGILPSNPFQTLDQEGVGRLVRIAVQEGRARRPNMEIGICGEHGGDTASIDFCHRIKMDYVSCSPFRVPVARLAAAQAAIRAAPLFAERQIL